MLNTSIQWLEIILCTKSYMTTSMKYFGGQNLKMAPKRENQLNHLEMRINVKLLT